jgi:hypothetical protein
MAQTHPVNLWGALTAKLASQQLVMGLLSLAVVVLGSTLAWEHLRGTPMYFIPPGGPGLAQPGVIGDGVATAYASRWLTARYTFTPATLKATHAEIGATLHPSLTLPFEVQAKREAVLVKEAHLATQLQVREATVSRRALGQVTVTLDGIRTVWIGGQQVREEPIKAEMTLAPWYSRGDPVGLVVLQATMTPVLSVSGS